MAGPPESDALSPPPEVVSDLASSCVRFVEKALGLTLDYTQDTLPLLDHYVAEAEEVSEEILSLLAPACGAYFGEVVRRHFGEGAWHLPADDDWSELALELPSASIRFNPMAVAIEVATGDTTEGFNGHFAVAEGDRELARAAVERLGEVEEAAYFTFAVRFDVLAQVHATLTRGVSES